MKAFQFSVLETEINSRLDKWLAEQLPDVSRSQVQRLIEKGYVKVNNRPAKGSYRVVTNDQVEVTLPEPEAWYVEPEEGPVEVVFEDDDLILVNKQPGLVVHPAPGHKAGTLVNFLLAHCKKLSGVGGVLRPGVVHRLDQGTSGLLVFAKNDRAHRSLAEQFHEHSITREYIAIVFGQVSPDEGVIEASIGRSPSDRKKMATVPSGKHAITHWKVLGHFPQLSLLRLTLQTGRTHQIRVHLNSKGWSVVGDPAYGGSEKRLKTLTNTRVSAALKKINHPLLHAERLAFVHPGTGERLDFKIEPPEDFQKALEILRGK
ncbi:RluA family pseudouridine synthase [Bdellovibrionota bacterium]